MINYVISERCSSSYPSYFWSVLTLPWQAGRWGSVGFSGGSTGLESIYPDFPDRRDGIPASSKSPTVCLLAHRGWHMTAALIIQPCLSVDIPIFLRLGHELQTILRECPLTESAEPLMRLAGILPLMWLSVHNDVPFQRDRPGNGVSCTQKGLGMCVCLSYLCVTFLEY